MSSSNHRPVAIITGASSGIGAGTAVYLAEQGYDLSLTGRDQTALQETKQKCLSISDNKTTVISTIGDITKKGISKAVVDNTIAKFGRLDTLINSAGILVWGGAAATPLDEYDRQFDINVKSVIEVTQFSIEHLLKTSGTIVNVSSCASLVPGPNIAYYCMSKATLDMFTKCLALELASQGVRVNAVNPAVIETDIHKRAGMAEQQYQKFLEECKKTHALGRVGQVEEVAKAIAFLAGSDSSFTTGEILRVDGGRAIMGQTPNVNELK